MVKRVRIIRFYIYNNSYILFYFNKNLKNA